MPHSLLAIILVASTSGRRHIAFTYPASPQATQRSSRPVFGRTFALADRLLDQFEPDEANDEAEPIQNGTHGRTATRDDPLEDGQRTPPLFGENSWLGKPKTKDEQAEVGFEYLGLKGDLLADLLLPRHGGLYNNKLELVINHLAFVGHPVVLDKPSPASEISTDNRSRRPTMSSNPSDSSSQVTSPLSSMSRGATSQESGPWQFSGNGNSTPERPAWTPSASTSSRDAKPATTLDRFNLVLVIDTPPDKPLSQQLGVYYRDIVVKLTAALKGEERRNGWLTSEIARCRAVRAEYKPTQNEAITSKLVSASPLCAALASVFDDLDEGKVAHVEALNGNLDLSLLLHNELLEERPLDGYRDAGIVEHYNPLRPIVPGVQADGDGGLPPLAPWHTLLPLVEPEVMLDGLEPGIVADFVERLSPKKPLTEYEIELDLDADLIREIAHHLVYWRKVRVISTVSTSKPHAPHPALDRRRLPALSHSFASRFSALGPLPTILSLSASAPTFRKAIPPQVDRHTANDALVWLLQHDCLVQLHTYVRVIATPAIRRAAYRSAAARSALPPPPSTPSAAEGRSGSVTGSSVDDNSLGRTPESLPAVDDEELEDREDRASSVINEPARPSTVERRWLEQILLGRDDELVEHFQRMLPLLNGRFHLEAIAHHTSLSMREIKHILDAFGDVIVTFLS